MKIVFISDGAAFCNIVVPGVYRGEVMDERAALDAALSCAFDHEYFDPDLGGEYERRVRSANEVLRINFEGHHIAHTTAEWTQIYEGIVREPVIISQSEY